MINIQSILDNTSISIFRYVDGLIGDENDRTWFPKSHFMWKLRAREEVIRLFK